MAGGIEAEFDEPGAASTSGEGVIFVLEMASLEAAKVRRREGLVVVVPSCPGGCTRCWAPGVLQPARHARLHPPCLPLGRINLPSVPSHAGPPLAAAQQKTHHEPHTEHRPSHCLASTHFLSLPLLQVGKNYELLNCDDHANFLRRHGKDPALYRPDICHQVREGRGRGGQSGPPGQLQVAAGGGCAGFTGALPRLPLPGPAYSLAPHAPCPATRHPPPPTCPLARRCWPSWTAR